MIFKIINSKSAYRHRSLHHICLNCASSSAEPTRKERTSFFSTGKENAEYLLSPADLNSIVVNYLEVSVHDFFSSYCYFNGVTIVNIGYISYYIILNKLEQML